MAADWVKFHVEITRGVKRGIPRALRFVLMEIALHARPLRGRIELAKGMSDEAAVLDLLSGDASEVRAALAEFTSGEHPTLIFKTANGRRCLVFPSWEKWNGGNDGPGSSTARVQKHRAKRSKATADVTVTETVSVSLPVALPKHPRLDQIRSEERRSDQIPSVCVDPDPGSTARANPTSTHTEGGVTPESLMADVRRYPSLCALAADEQAIADMAYAAAISGMPAEAASEAVSAFSIARAAEIPSMTPEALKRALGSFLARQRSGGNGRPKPEPMDPDVRQCVDDFRAAWSRANGGKPLPPASGDDRHAAEVVRLAKAAAAMPGVKASPRDVWRHVMRGYCGDGDHALSDQAHPLALLPSRFSRYGMPGARAAAPKPLDSASLPGPRKLPPGLAPGPGMTPDEIMRAVKSMK